MNPWSHHHRRFIGILALMLGIMGCSRVDRARRAIRASRAAFGESVAALMGGQPDRARLQAEQSLRRAQQAERLMAAGPLKSTIDQQVKMSGLLVSAFKEPASAVQLWFAAMAQDEDALVLYILDWRRLCDATLAASGRDILAKDLPEIENVFRESCKLSIRSYEDLLSNWVPAESQGEIQGKEATIRATITFANELRRMTFWLHQEDQIWRVFDFTIGTQKASESMGILIARLDQDVQLPDFFRGRGIFDALADIEDAGQVDVVFTKRPLLGRYVRLMQDATLYLHGQEVHVEKNRIVKVIDQVVAGDGDGSIRVRTTESDRTKSAVGSLSADAVEVIGTDESEIWGLDALRDS